VKPATAASPAPVAPPIELEPKRSVLARVTLSNSEVYRRIAKGEFPAPVKLSPDGRRVAWVRSEVDRWLAERIAARR
jgi:prophage regulatory protein